MRGNPIEATLGDVDDYIFDPPENYISTTQGDWFSGKPSDAPVKTGYLSDITDPEHLAFVKKSMTLSKKIEENSDKGNGVVNEVGD